MPVLKRLGNRVDVVVIGAGPAGTTAARLLAEWGHSVALVSRPPERRSLAESLPPSIRKLLAHVGILKRVERAGFLPATGNTAWWGDAQGRAEDFAGETGFQVLRSEFDRLLFDAARQSGVRCLLASVSRVEVGEAVTTSVAFGRRRLHARFVLDCSGRAGVLGRRFRVKEKRLAMVALNGVWESAAAFPGVEATRTLVESYADGWAWSVPLSPRRRHVAFMMDPRPGARYQDELRKTTQLRRVLDAATLVEKPWACDASVYGARAFAGPRFLLVGDAGSFLDPMSSFGVKKALASAWLAAVVANTCLRHPERSQAALRLFESREREMAATYARESARHAREVADRYATPFWTRRAEAEASVASEDALLRSAFLTLKASERVSLRLAEDARFTQAAEVRGREVVLREALTAPALPEPVRYVRGVELPRVARLALECDELGEVFEAYNRSGAAVPLPDLLAAVSFLLAKGIVTPKKTY